MADHEHIFRELHTSIAESLHRSEERMSHVQRQLAGWQEPPKPASSLPDDGEGWENLKNQATHIVENVDQDLALVESSLKELVQQGRQWRAKRSQ